MPENKKVKNATPTTVDGIEFKSSLEARIYRHLRDAGFEPVYEGISFNLIDAFYPQGFCFDPHYDYGQKKKVFGLNKTKVQAITYTPDFSFNIDDKLIVIECKGKENDVFPIKKKLFRRWIDAYKRLTGVDILYFEIHKQSELEESIAVMQSLSPQ